MSNSISHGAGKSRVIEGLKVPPFNTTLMGVIRGVADHLGVAASDATLYGASGHAFMINIHAELCPSGPYCWKREPFVRLLRNLGIEMTDLGFFSVQATAAERERIEAFLRDRIDRGIATSLLNFENQLITGYDATGFFTTQPWPPHTDFPPGRLEFGSWKEFGDAFHTNFYTFGRIEAADPKATVLESLLLAADIHSHPENHTDEPYATGRKAYMTWIQAVRKGHGSSHGNWWNATVWGECRSMAAGYLREIAAEYPAGADVASAMAADYEAIAERLVKISDRQMDPDAKIALLTETAELEVGCAPKIDALVRAMQGS
jgi:hypothetical protein